MASSSSPVFAPSYPFAVLAASSLMGLGLLHLAELPKLVAQHGGVYFLGAWLLCLLLLALPVVLTEWMLGRRSCRSPIEGLAALTRDADAKRGWRASAWGMTAAALLAAALVALVTGGSANTLVRGLELVDGTVQAGQIPAWILPTVAVVTLLIAAGLALLPMRLAQAIPAIGLPLVFVLLALPALANMSTWAVTYPAKPLTYADWRMAAQLALLATGAGLGVFWAAAAALPASASLGRLGLLWVVLQAVLAVVLMLAMSPYVAVETLRASMDIELVPTGLGVGVAQVALLVLGVLVVALLLQPVAAWLKEKGLVARSAVLAATAVALVLTLLLWALLSADGFVRLLSLFPVLLGLVLAGQSIFAGWAMKVSHARKALNLPSEGIYNLWRVAVRLLVPLALLWVLVGLLLRAVA